MNIFDPDFDKVKDLGKMVEILVDTYQSVQYEGFSVTVLANGKSWVQSHGKIFDLEGGFYFRNRKLVPIP